MALLKVVRADHPDEVFASLKDHADRMPRTAFHYALEKLPEEQRQEAKVWRIPLSPTNQNISAGKKSHVNRIHR
ncbi:hypothetical protein [Methanogenium cariaci]|jgi:hypothetical protein